MGRKCSRIGAYQTNFLRKRKKLYGLVSCPGCAYCICNIVYAELSLRALSGKCNSSRYLLKKHISSTPVSILHLRRGSQRFFRLLYNKQFPKPSFLSDAYCRADWTRNIIYNMPHEVSPTSAVEVFVIMFMHITILGVATIINVSGQY